jgi:hypothetical protein
LLRFSMRMRICSLASAGSAALCGDGVFAEVTIHKFTGDSLEFPIFPSRPRGNIDSGCGDMDS